MRAICLPEQQLVLGKVAGMALVSGAFHRRSGRKYGIVEIIDEVPMVGVHGAGKSGLVLLGIVRPGAAQVQGRGIMAS